MLPYTLYIWFACMVYNVPQAVIAFIMMKAFIKVLISGTIIELILHDLNFKNFLAGFKS
jgi:hypothetical protein